MSIEECGVDPESLKETSKTLFSISQNLQDIHVSVEEADLDKFVRNGFKTRFFESLDDVVNSLSSEVSDGAFYLDRFESALVGSRLKGLMPVRDVQDVDWYDLKTGVSYADLLAVDTGSLIFIEDSIQTNITSYPEKLYIIVSANRLTQELLSSFDVIYSLNRLFGDKFLVRIVNAPSRTGDIEKKIVFGAHGPKEVYIYLYRDELSVSHIMLSYLALENYSVELCLRREGYTLDQFLARYGGYREALGLEI